MEANFHSIIWALMHIALLLWISLNLASVYSQTHRWYYVPMWLGPSFSLISFSIAQLEVVAKTINALGYGILVFGVVSILLFGADFERQRWRLSSMQEIILGRVPKPLCAPNPNRKFDWFFACGVLLVASLLTFLAGNLTVSLYSLALAVFSVYRGFHPK